MKNKVMCFVIGFLVGAIVATAGFYCYNKFVVKDSNQAVQSNENGEMKQPGGNMGEQPEKPDGDNENGGAPQSNGEEPPAKPDDSNSEKSENSNENNTSETSTKTNNSNSNTNNNSNNS